MAQSPASIGMRLEAAYTQGRHCQLSSDVLTQQVGPKMGQPGEKGGLGVSTRAHPSHWARFDRASRKQNGPDAASGPQRAPD
jgi:hypothetical protein